MKYDEFVDWAVQTLIDAFITGGFREVRTKFQYTVMVVLYQNKDTILPN